MNKLICRIHVAILVVIATIVLLSSERVLAQGDGPRAYQILPDGTNIVALYGIFTNGNQSLDPGTIIQGSDIDVNLGVLQYIHTISVGGKQAALFGVLPFGEVKGSIDLPGSTFSGRSSGIGDFQLGSIFGLIGTPALPIKEYSTLQPGFTLGVLGKLFIPTGEYDDNKLFNLGANRWAVQIGVPMTYYLGTSFIDPSLLTFELLPSVFLYGDNDDLSNANTREQDPLFNLEEHITWNLNKMIWFSADALYTYGGETTTDGVKGRDTQSAFFLGGTVNFTLSRSVSLQLSYGKTVSRNDNGPDGSMIRTIVNFAF